MKMEIEEMHSNQTHWRSSTKESLILVWIKWKQFSWTWKSLFKELSLRQTKRILHHSLILYASLGFFMKHQNNNFMQHFKIGFEDSRFYLFGQLKKSSKSLLSYPAWKSVKSSITCEWCRKWKDVFKIPNTDRSESDSGTKNFFLFA